MAAEAVKISNLKSFFTDKAEDRYDFSHKLKAQIKGYGESLDKGTSVKGDIHCGWINFKSAFTSDDDEAVLEEAIRGEKAAREEYKDIMEDPNLSPTIDAILREHRNGIQKSLQEVKRLEDLG